MHIITYIPATRDHWWVNDDHIEREYPEWLDKIEDVLLSNRYGRRTKEIAQSIYNHLSLFEYISWNQFDCVMRMRVVLPTIHTIYNGGWKALNDRLDEIGYKHNVFNDDDIDF